MNVKLNTVRVGGVRDVTRLSLTILRRGQQSCRAFASNIKAGELIYPDPPSTEHHDIRTYKAYAARTGLDTSSTTYVGTLFEYTVAAALQTLGFSIKRIGGRGDYGIDLVGTWTVPSSAAPLRVLIQCKAAAANTKIGPTHIRELEGAFIGAPPGWRGPGVIGLLVTQRAATKGIRDSLGRSRWPMSFISCSAEGKLLQILWNSTAEVQGLAGLGVGVRLSEEQAQDQELVLTWKGKPTSPEWPLKPS
ncbi:hypothetical protein BX600DRAFT_22203 [Xylariales sp. PMI_506]|nr:hypothetical protein BX600DRAFT_22203 [Xylariales sp. PMI_506]